MSEKVDVKITHPGKPKASGPKPKGKNPRQGPKKPGKRQRNSVSRRGGPNVGAAKQLAAKGAASVITKVIDAITNPQDHAPVRFSDSYAADPTAVAHVFIQPDADPVLSTDSQTYGLTSGQMEAFLFRDPLRSYIVYDPNHSAAQAKYNCYWVPGEVASDVSETPAISNNITLGGEGGEVAYLIQASFWTATTTRAPHGTTQFCGYDNTNKNPGKFVWFDAGETLTAQCDSQDADFDVSLLQWQPNGVGNAIAMTVSATFKVQSLSHTPGRRCDNNNIVPDVAHISTMTVATEGYYAIRVANTSAALTTSNFVTNLRFYKQCTGPSWGHRCIPYYDTKAGIIPSVRVTAASVMLSNTSNVLNKAGVIYGYQSSENTNWEQFVFGASPINISSVNRNKRLPADKGMFAWLKPTGRPNFDFQAYIQTSQSGTVTGSCFPLMPVYPYLVLKADLGGVDNAANFSGNWTFAFGIEFKTRDQFFDLEAPSDSAMLFDMAASQLRNAPQFTENPLHFSKLFKAARSIAQTIAKGIVDYGPMAVNMAETVGRLI